MAKYDCDICRGSGRIRIPVCPRLSVTAVMVETVPDQALVESSREFPCPQCSEMMPIGRVHAITERITMDTRITDPEYVRSIKDGLAHQLVAHLLHHNYIQFQRGPNDLAEVCYPMRATIAVASPKALDTLEERIGERQIEIANEVVTEAITQIDNWGSHYGHSEILKQDARPLIRNSIKTVLARRMRWKRMPSHEPAPLTAEQAEELTRRST